MKPLEVGVFPEPVQQGPFVMRSQWPTATMEHHDEGIERQFSEFQEVVGAIRKIRASQSIPPRESVPVAIRCTEASEELLRPMAAYFGQLAGADIVSIGPSAQPFDTDAPLALTAIDMTVHVDLEKFIDVEAEHARLEKRQGQLEKQISGKEQKLSNESFVARAPADVVQRERQGLDELLRELEMVKADLEKLKAKIES